MQSTLAMAALSLSLLATAAAAQPADAQASKPANFSLPQAYSGYSQPEITDCASSAPGVRSCSVPAMTAGQYVITAAGGATSNAAKSAQGLLIRVGNTPCEGTGGVAFTGDKAVQIYCVVSILTDQPLTISAEYKAQGAAIDAGFPKLAVRRIAWNGVVEMRGGIVPAQAAKPAPAKP